MTKPALALWVWALSVEIDAGPVFRVQNGGIGHEQLHGKLIDRKAPRLSPRSAPEPSQFRFPAHGLRVNALALKLYPYAVFHPPHSGWAYTKLLAKLANCHASWRAAVSSAAQSSEGLAIEGLLKSTSASQQMRLKQSKPLFKLFQRTAARIFLRRCGFSLGTKQKVVNNRVVVAQHGFW